MINKKAQYTLLDKNIHQPSHREEMVEQQWLPFKDDKTKSHFMDIVQEQNAQKRKGLPTKEPINLQYPELSPENIKYRPLNEKEKARLDSETEGEYEDYQRRTWDKNRPFQPSDHLTRYHELNKALPEDIKKKVIDKYNELKRVSADFYVAYKEANEMAKDEPVLDYGQTYAELVKNFGRFIVAASKKQIGALFGLVSGTGSRYNYENKTSTLIDFLRRGLNVFNITPFNVDTKIHEMDSVIYAMNDILKEVARRKKLLTKLPEEMAKATKSFLLRKKNRELLKWLDEYFPNDKQDFMETSVNDLMSGNSGSFSLDNLRKFKTYSEIYYNASQKATNKLRNELDRKSENAIEERLKEQITIRIEPKLTQLKQILDIRREQLAERTHPNDTPLSDYINNILAPFIYKNYKLDLKSIIGFVNTILDKKYEGGNPGYTTKKSEEFLGNFVEDLQEKIKQMTDGSWTIKNYIEDYTRRFMRENQTQKYDKGYPAHALNIEKLEKLSSKDIDHLTSKIIKDVIVNAMPNFKSQGYSGFSLPEFSGLGDIIKETGKFSIDAVLQYAHKFLPFVPKDFLLHLIRTIFKNPYSVNKEGDDQANFLMFKEIFNLAGTNAQLAVKAILDLLKRTGKMSPDNFTNVFIKYINDFSIIVSRIQSQLKNKLTDEQILEIFPYIIRNKDTIEQDRANLDKFIEFLHNSAGDINYKYIIEILKNKNYLTYAKVGISKKLINAYARIRDLGGANGIVKNYGQIIQDMIDGGFISKAFFKNIRFVVMMFNSGEQFSPASPEFKKIFEITSTLETDLETLEISDTLKDLLKDYSKKDERLFKLDMQINDRLRFRVLKDKDPRMLRIGIESNCCQRIGGVGEVAARDSFVNPLAGVLVLEWKNGGDWVLLTQSYFHYVPKDNGYILDNVESNNRNVQDSGVDIEAAYAYLGAHIKGSLDVGYFLAGKGYSKIEDSSFRTTKMKGGDPRFFDKKALPDGKGDFYSDFAPSNSIDLLKPKFDLDRRVGKLTGRAEEVREAFEKVLGRIIKTSMVAG